MSVTSGFFNALNHDRRYNAEQMSAIFDGIINNGVFANIGTAFFVKADVGNTVIVGIGRAWFNSAWLLNDSLLPLTASISEILLNRIDAVVIEIDHRDSVRDGSIKIVKGTPSSSPKRPDMVRTPDLNQYPLAFIYRKANSNSIVQADITNMIGSSSTPYITGILQVQNTDNIVAQWKSQWEVFYNKQTADMTTTNTFWKQQWSTWFQAQTSEIQEAYLNWEYQWKEWYSSQTTVMNDANKYWKDLWQAWFYDYVNNSTKELAYWKKLVTEDWKSFHDSQTADMTATNIFWKQQWSTWFQAQTAAIQEAYLNWESQWTAWYTSQTSEMTDTNKYWKDLWQAWFYDYVNSSTEEYSEWKASIDQDFKSWWDSLKILLKENPAAEFAVKLLDLQNRTEILEGFMNNLESEHCVYDALSDYLSGEITDSIGSQVKCKKAVFLVQKSLGISADHDDLIKVIQQLNKKIESLESFAKNLTNEFMICDILLDGGSWLSGDYAVSTLTEQILDHNGASVDGRVIFALK